MKKLLGKRIKELRVKNKLTQEQLAELLNMGERNLSKIECGINFVSADTLEKIINAFNISAKDLFDFEHLQEEDLKKTELIERIQNDDVDVNLLYRIYMAIKK